MIPIFTLFSDAVMAGCAGASRHVSVVTISVISTFIIPAAVFLSVFFTIAFDIQALNAGSATHAAIVPG